MASFQVAICGAPLAGKNQLLLRLAEHIPSSTLDVTSTELDRIVRLDIPRAGSVLSVLTISGFILSPELTFPKILTNADAIVYMLSATSSQVPQFSPTVPDQQKYFDYYTSHAKQMGCFWTNKPWMWLLNKVDRASEIPPLNHLPPSVRTERIRCVATTGQGIDQVWAALKRLAP